MAKIKIDDAKALVRLRLKIIEQKKKSDLLFERILDLDLEDRKECLCYFFGAMADRIEDDNIALLDKWIEEKKKYRAEELLPAEPSLCEVKGKAEEEVDVSDCCKREDPKCIQPPLRSSVQDSPDDPYYVCGYCGDKCELITIKRSEPEDCGDKT